MAECYPTGCTPCDSPIKFPESPLDGDRYCVDLKGIDNGQKCWVYDKCIPGWRAEGPNSSPAAVYRGGINIKTQKPGDNIEAGHFYIQTVSVTSPYQTEWGTTVGSTSPVIQNSRIAFNGEQWEVIPGPEVPYASDALGNVPLDANGKPTPDNRQGGIVKTATLSQARAGTDKCDVITPFTLRGALSSFTPDVGEGDLFFDTSNDIEFSYPNGDDDFNANKFTDTTVTAVLTDTSVTPGEYINAQITVDQKGRILEASNGILAGALYLADDQDFSQWNGSNYTLRPGETDKKNGDTIINTTGTTSNPATINPTLKNLIRNSQDIQGSGNNQVYRGDMVIYIDPNSEQGEAGKPYFFLPRDLGVNLDYQASATNGVIENSAGADATIPLATETLAGLMSPGDKNIVNTGFNLDYDAFPTKGEIKRVVDGSVIVTIPAVSNVNAGLITPALVDELANPELDLDYEAKVDKGIVKDGTSGNEQFQVPLVTNTLSGLMSPGEHIKLDALANLDALYLADVKDFSSWNGDKGDYNYRPDADPKGPLRGDVILNNTGDFAAGGATMSSGLKAKIFNPQDFRSGDEVVRGDKIIYVPDADNATSTKYWLFLPTEQLFPEVGDGKVEFFANGVSQGSITMNQATDKNIDITVDLPDIGDGKINVNYGTSFVGSFNVNQDNDQTITVPQPNNPTITFVQAGNDIGSITLNQSSNATLEFTDATAGPGAQIPGEFAALVNGSVLQWSRGFDRYERVGKGEYRLHFTTTQPGASKDNMFTQVAAGSGGSPDMAASIGIRVITETYIGVTTGYNNSAPDDEDRICLSAWRIS